MLLIAMYLPCARRPLNFKILILSQDALTILPTKKWAVKNTLSASANIFIVEHLETACNSYCIKYNTKALVGGYFGTGRTIYSI